MARQQGYDPVYGARPLKRVIQAHVQNPLSDLILAGKVHDGDTVRIGATAADAERGGGEGGGVGSRIEASGGEARCTSAWPFYWKGTAAAHAAIDLVGVEHLIYSCLHLQAGPKVGVLTSL